MQPVSKEVKLSCSTKYTRSCKPPTWKRKEKKIFLTHHLAYCCFRRCCRRESLVLLQSKTDVGKNLACMKTAYISLLIFFNRHNSSKTPTRALPYYRPHFPWLKGSYSLGKCIVLPGLITSSDGETTCSSRAFSSAITFLKMASQFQYLELPTSSPGRFSPVLEVGWEKALVSADHMSTKQPQFVGVLN